MKKLFLSVLLLCLMGCTSQPDSYDAEPSVQPESVMENQPMISEETLEEIHQLFCNDPVFDRESKRTGYDVVVKSEDNQITVHVDHVNVIPAVTIKRTDSQLDIQYCFNQRIDFHYDHPDEEDRLAYLQTNYYVHPFDSSLTQEVLICTLDVPESTEFDSFQFVYDSNSKQFLSDDGEPIIFAKDLKNKMIYFCDSFLERNATMKTSADYLVSQTMRIIENTNPDAALNLSELEIKSLTEMFNENNELIDYGNRPAQVFVQDNQIFIDCGPRERPTLVMTKENGWSFERYYYVRYDQVDYQKNGEQRKAILMMEYVVDDNSENEDFTLLCRLETPTLEPTGYNFIYHSGNDELIGSDGEEITFTKDLHYKLLEICKKELSRIRALDVSLMYTAYEAVELMDN